MKKWYVALVLALVLCLSISVAMAATVTPATVQAALDAAEVNAVIELEPGNYGTLYIRQSDKSTVVWSGHGGGSLGGYTNGKLRFIDGLTIKGSEGAVVEGIVFESNKYGSNHSQGSTIPYLDSYIKVNNFVIEGITFDLNGNVAIDTGVQTGINGLTVKNCVVKGSGSGNVERLMYVGGSDAILKDLKAAEILTTGVDNVKILNNKVSDVHQVLELRQVNNIEISGNEFKNVRARDILLNGGTAGAISGDIVISGNTSDGSTEVFLRLNNVQGDVEINDNTITDCTGDEDGLAMKITNTGAGTSIGLEDNTINGIPVYFAENSEGGLVVEIPDEPVYYDMYYEGGEKKYDGKAVFTGKGNLVFESPADLDKFAAALIFKLKLNADGEPVMDGEEPVYVLEKGQSSSFVKVTEGSTVVTLTESFLKTLEDSLYGLVILSENGLAEGEFTVAKVKEDPKPVAPTTPEKPSVPRTGDESNIALWIALMGLAVAGIIVAGKKARFN